MISRASSSLWPFTNNIYEEVLSSKVKRNLVKVDLGYGHHDFYLEVDDHVSNLIDMYFQTSKDGQYADLTLHEFLDKVCDVN